VISALARLFRFQRRPLAAMRPDAPKRQVPLGMEAMDLKLIDRVTRQNQALDRTSGAGLMNTGHGRLGDSESRAVIDMPQDETYASRYHAAFKSKDT